jgi:hypothetical protein
MVCNLITYLRFFIGYWILHGAAFRCGLFRVHNSSGALRAISVLLAATAARSISYNRWALLRQIFQQSFSGLVFFAAKHVSWHVAALRCNAISG